MDFSQRIKHKVAEAYSTPLMDAQNIPRIDLYMEQVTTFFENELADGRRRDNDKILTKTMINNYTKYGVLQHPKRKKYSREHMISLLYIFLLKNVLSIQDIKVLFDMIPSPDQASLEPIYNIYRDMVNDYRDNYEAQLQERIDMIDKELELKGIHDDNHKRMMLISLLASEAAVHKLVAGKLIDEYSLDLKEEKMRKAAEIKKAVDKK